MIPTTTRPLHDVDPFLGSAGTAIFSHRLCFTTTHPVRARREEGPPRWQQQVTSCAKHSLPSRIRLSVMLFASLHILISLVEEPPGTFIFCASNSPCARARGVLRIKETYGACICTGVLFIRCYGPWHFHTRRGALKSQKEEHMYLRYRGYEGGAGQRLLWIPR